MRFGAPEWFLCLVIVALAAAYWRSLRTPLRLLCLLLLVIFAARPQIQRFGRGLDLWVLADRSASAATSVEPRLAEWQQILERSKGPDDRICVVDYAAEAALRDSTAFSELTGSREASRMTLAAKYALSQMAAGRACRLLALTDGFATEPPGNLAEQLRRQGVVLDYRIASETGVRDFSVESLSAPSRSRPMEPFVVELRVKGPEGGQTPFELMRDGKPLAHGSVEIRQGRGIARFTDRMGSQGGHRYSVRLKPETDAHPGNNTGERWVEIAGGANVVLVTNYTGDPLAEVLRAQGVKVDLITDLSLLHEGLLTGARTVILNNIPAFKLPVPFLKALDFFVREQGGGLLMAGGKASFACGGYFGSPISDLLPVSMEMRQEQRKMATALAIEIDRSGSMGMPTSDGRTKIQLAGAGAARAAELLGPGDEVAVVAVDTEPHEIVPLCTVGADGARLGETIRRIMSAGGGIFIDVALKDAYYRLRLSPSGQRHLILLADANDSEQPGDFKDTLAQMRQHKITVSVIGLGSERDKDAALLREIAALGNGRIYFASEAGELPAMFEQETVAVARAAFVEEPVAVKPMAGWAELASRPLPWPGTVDGFNLSYLRPGASAAAVTNNEDAAPLVAFWQRGTGRVAAVTFPLGGDFSSHVRSWPAYGDFSQTLTRWLMGASVAPGIVVRADVDGTTLNAELLYDSGDPLWEKTFAQNAPKLVISGEKPAASTPLVWQRMEPGCYRSTAALEPGQMIRGAVQIGNTVIPFGPLQASSGAEWEFDPAKPLALKEISRASGGEERLDLASIWKAPRPAEYGDVRHWLLPILLLLFLAEALMTRLGWKLPEGIQISRFAPKFPRVRLPRRAREPAPAASKPEPEVTSEPREPDRSRQDRFRRAKHRNS